MPSPPERIKVALLASFLVMGQFLCCLFSTSRLWPFNPILVYVSHSGSEVRGPLLVAYSSTEEANLVAMGWCSELFERKLAAGLMSMPPARRERPSGAGRLLRRAGSGALCGPAPLPPDLEFAYRSGEGKGAGGRMPFSLKWWFQPGSARRLGISRCLFYLWYWLQFSYYNPGEFAGLPASLWQPVALVQVLGPPDPGWFSLLAWLAHPAFLLAALGLWTRLSTLVVAVAAALPLAWMQCYGFPEFHLLPLVLISWILPWSACGDAFSLDARWGRQARVKVDSGCYTWPIRLCWLTLLLPMASAGFHKLLGSWPGQPVATMEWFLRLKFVVHGEMKAAQPWAFMAIPLSYPWMLAIMSWGTLVFELGCPLALLDRPRFLRPLWIGGLFLMQLVLAVGLLTLKSFPWLGAYLFWVPWGEGPGWRDGS